MDLIGCTITTLGDDHFPTENANNCILNNQLMLVSAHVILNMTDKKNNQKECPDDDDQNDMDDTKCLFNYLKVSHVLAAMQIGNRNNWLL